MPQGNAQPIAERTGGRSGAFTKMSENIDSGSSVARARAIADCGESTSEASSIPSEAAHPMMTTYTRTDRSSGRAPTRTPKKTAPIPKTSATVISPTTSAAPMRPAR